MPGGMRWQKDGRLGHAQPVMVVDAQHRPRPDRLAQFGRARCAVRPMDSRGSNRLAIAAGIGMPGAGADDVPAALDQQLHLLDQLRPHRRAGGGEAGHVVALLAAQQLVDRHAQRLAGDVVQGDVDGRDRRRSARARPRNTGCGTSPATARRYACGSRPIRNSR